MKEAIAGGDPMQSNMPYSKTVIVQPQSWQAKAFDVVQDKIGTFGISVILGLVIGYLIIRKVGKDVGK